MTLDELNTVLKIINDDLEERTATNTPAKLYDSLKDRPYRVKDILDKGILHIDFKPGVVVPIMGIQEISHYHLARHYHGHEDEAINMCKRQIAHSIADCPDFNRHIRFTIEDNYTKGCTVITGEVLIAKHL